MQSIAKRKVLGMDKVKGMTVETKVKETLCENSYEEDCWR